MEGKTFIVNSYHDMGIYLIGDDIEVIAESNDGIEAFKHISLPHWGIVWHPERMDNPVLPKEIADMLNG
jgi:putative glutamine amidotransferase